jgi:hypothetical protein
MRHYDIMQCLNGIWNRKTVTLACCHFCGGDELVVSDVERDGYEPEEWPSAVMCGGCGAQGPWGTTEYRAVKAWNTASDVKTESLTDWTPMASSGPQPDDGCPF